MNSAKPILAPDELLFHWQGHRALTRRVIEAFPEQELMSHSVGGMRPFAELAKELLAIAVPGLKEIVGGEIKPFNDENEKLNSKAALLNAWDEATLAIDELWAKIPLERFRENVRLFGEYDFPVIQNVLYFIDNEIHHRAQGYVYLRTLGIQPPFFWERQLEQPASA